MSRPGIRRIRVPRGYSREFTPHGTTGKRYTLDDIPAGFWNRVRVKAAHEGVSMRGLILGMLREWLERDEALGDVPEAPET